MDDLERIELSAVLDFFAAAPPDVVEVFDLAVLHLGGPAAFSIGAHPTMLLFNRVLGLDDAARLPELEAVRLAEVCVRDLGSARSGPRGSTRRAWLSSGAGPHEVSSRRGRTP